MSYSFEISLDQIVIERNIYTMLDLLSDIGGFITVIMSGISIALAIWNYRNFEYHFLINFFRMKSSKTIENNSIKYSGENFVPKKICNIHEYFLDRIPALSKVRGCRRNTRHAAIEKAR